MPNSGEELVRLDYRKTWDTEFLAYLQQLQSKKPLIACGDFNVAHREIDIARPKPNYNKSAGYTQVEIDGFSRFLDAGLIDTFRHFHPGTVAYSWWSFRAGARAKKRRVAHRLRVDQQSTGRQSQGGIYSAGYYRIGSLSGRHRD